MNSPAKYKKAMFKIPMLGEGAVGKTTLVRAFMGGTVSSGEYKGTLGAEIGLKKLNLTMSDGDRIEIQLQLWDLAGQPAFKAIRGTFYVGSVGAILVYDLGRPETLDKLDEWLKELHSSVAKPIPITLVGNKKDLRETGEAVLSTDAGKQKATEITQKTGYETPFIEASAIRSENADKPFERLAAIVYENREALIR
ncbi:MAG: Rab family GTPase [Candidatus Hodarchaeales archaeon]|jgi:small GTP-binding protein